MRCTTIQQRTLVTGFFCALAGCCGVVYAQDSTKQLAPPKSAEVKSAVVMPEDFPAVMTRMQAAKEAIQQRHLDLLKELKLHADEKVDLIEFLRVL